MDAPLLAAGAGSVAGAVLGWAAFRMETSDERPDWRGRSRRVQFAVTVGCLLVSAFSAAAAVYLAPTWATAIGVGAFAGAGPGLAVMDLAARRLPFAVLGLVALAAVAGMAGAPAALARALGVAAIVGAAALVLSLATRTGAGLGDILYVAIAALTLAWDGWAAVLTCVAVAVVVPPFALLVTRLARGSWVLLPFGPWLLVGWWVALLS
jgi:leader peptidase (prepilin peptidase) / N-methyltransferase